MTDVPHPYLAAAMGVAILGFGTLWAALRSGLERLPVGCLEVTPVLFLVAVASWVYLPLVLGVPPTTGDNGFHLLKMMETSDFLQGHRLLGWSDMEGAGFPHNVNYPAAGALFGALIHRIFNIGWERAYAWTLLLQVHSVVLALYFAARLHYSRFAGLIAGLLGLLDPGGWWVGGHFSDIEGGCGFNPSPPRSSSRGWRCGRSPSSGGARASSPPRASSWGSRCSFTRRLRSWEGLAAS